MKFGDDDFVVMLKSTSDYETVYPIVDHVIRPFVYRKIHVSDGTQEEVLQEIHVAVWQALPQYLSCAESYSPQQRLGWLYTIASNKINDLFRAAKQSANSCTALSEAVPDPSGSPEEQFLCQASAIEQEKRVDNLLRDACSLRSRPENKLAFLYNRVIMPLDTGHARKGDSQKVAAYLEGQSLGQIRWNLEKDLARVMDRELPKDVLTPLDCSLKGREKERFKLSPRQVAVGSYSISATLHARSALYQPGHICTNEEARGLSKNCFFFFFDNPRALPFYKVKPKKEDIAVSDTYKGISEKLYLTWLEGLHPGQAASLLPGILLETSRGNSTYIWADKFFSPLKQLNLFPFQGEQPWVEVVCTSWEDAALLPRQLARLCTTAAGLWGTFRGGIVLDLRWCSGPPRKGVLDPLVRFLLAGSGEFCPLFLAPPGSARTLQYELRLLDLQRILPEDPADERLKESVQQLDFLTSEEKDHLLRQSRQESSECAAAITHALHRLTHMGNKMDVTQIWDQITPPQHPRRQIGFEREAQI